MGFKQTPLNPPAYGLSDPKTSCKNHLGSFGLAIAYFHGVFIGSLFLKAEKTIRFWNTFVLLTLMLALFPGSTHGGQKATKSWAGSRKRLH